MRNVIKLVVLVCTAFAVFTSCNAIADTSGLDISPEMMWLRLTPSVPVLVDETWTAEVVLDFSKPVAVLKDDMSEEELNTFITFDYQNYPSGTTAEGRLRATAVKKSAEAVYTFTVINIPETAGIARVTINRTNMTPAYRPWSFDGRIIPDVDASAALLDFRFERSSNPTLLVDEVIGGIDQRQGTVFVVAPLHTILNPLTPTITTNIGNTYTPEAQTNFTESVNYIVKSAKTAAEKEYSVRVIPQELESARIYVFAFIKEENYTRRSLTLNANIADGLAATVYGIIDEEEKTIAVTVPFGTDVSALLPNITHSGESIAPAHLEAQDFTAPVKYTVRSADGAEFDYWVTVTETATYSITLLKKVDNEALDATHGLTFPDLVYGYRTKEIKNMQGLFTVGVFNTGNQDTGDLTVTLGGGNADSFALSSDTLPSILGSRPVAFDVQPNRGLDVGTHTATVTVSGDHDIQASFEVSITVNEGQFTVSPSISLAPGQEQLAWTIEDSDPAADSYDVYWILGSQTDVATVKGGTKISGAAAPTGTITGLTDSTTYSVMVIAHKAGYADCDSLIVSGTTYPVDEIGDPVRPKIDKEQEGMTYPVDAIGDPGPAGGWIFYDKGAYSDGWRYLEAAPVNQSNRDATWGLTTDNIEGTATDIGTGKENTHLIVAKYPSENYAANLCKNYRGGDKDDWFLPSKDELNLMWTNLKQQGLGDFSSSYYWSSSQYVTSHSWCQFFGDGFQYPDSKVSTLSVRAVRAF